jgi:cell division protein FtsQ
MAASLPAPLDVRLMNISATLMFVALAIGVLAGAVWWALRHQTFAIAGIAVHGDLAHNNAVTLRANVTPKLSGNFFTVDLERARMAFETVPWVRKAVVQREFPNRLKVSLQEHQPVAYWGMEGEPKLLNSFGEVFDANVGDLEQDDLPRLNGPVAQAGDVLAMYRAVKPLFEPLDVVLEELELTGRGSWRAQLDSGAVVELGRGTPDEVVARAQRFVRTLTQVTSQYGRSAEALESADLRHNDGYAVRLRGVTTGGAVSAAKK